MTCNVVLTAMNVLCSPEHYTLWDTRFYHLSNAFSIIMLPGHGRAKENSCKMMTTVTPPLSYLLLKRMKDEIFCFAHLRWSHNGWASNILSGGCRRTTTIKILVPIHYDTIKDGQSNKSHLLFSFLVRIVLFLHFIGGIYLSKILLHHFIGFIWLIIITPLMKINVSIRITRIITWCSSHV